MGDATMRVRTQTPDTSLRATWHDGTPLDVYFWKKGAGRSQVQLQHRELPSRAAADCVRRDWTERLTALGAALRDAR